MQAMISQLMTVAPVTLKFDASVRTALDTLDELGVRHVPIVDKNDELVGIVSDRDIRGFQVGAAAGAGPGSDSAAEDALDVAVADIMTRGVVSVSTRDDLITAIDALLEHRVGALPVVDSATGDIAGMLSYVDILKHFRAHLD